MQRSASFKTSAVADGNYFGSLHLNGKRVLITGGAGFVGSHTADALLEAGHEVCVYDNLTSQVHSGGDTYIPRGAKFVLGDVRDLGKLSSAVRDADVIFHFAAAVGVGQSMYCISDYTAVNNLGTANLLQAVLDTHSPVEKIVIASSMSIYGEGKYACGECGEVAPEPRGAEQLAEKRWEVVCQKCGQTLSPIPTTEDKPLQCTSIYALSKRDQEEMALLFGRTYQIPVVALRYFNIYGTRQSLSNPYTGVAAIFASRLMNGKPPIIFEDGKQMRDFVSVHDVVQANMLAMERSGVDGKAVNIGSGNPVTIGGVASELQKMLGTNLPVEISGKYRAGDVRHCYGDISAAGELLGYKPRWPMVEGMRELAEWLKSQQAEDLVDEAMNRLTVHGLVA